MGRFLLDYSKQKGLLPAPVLCKEAILFSERLSTLIVLNVIHQPAQGLKDVQVVHRLLFVGVVLPSCFEEFLWWPRNVLDDGMVELVMRPLINLEGEDVSEQSAIARIPMASLEKQVMDVTVVSSGDNSVLTWFALTWFASMTTSFSFHDNHHLPMRCCGLVHSQRLLLGEACH